MEKQKEIIKKWQKFETSPPLILISNSLSTLVVVIKLITGLEELHVRGRENDNSGRRPIGCATLRAASPFPFGAMTRFMALIWPKLSTQTSLPRVHRVYSWAGPKKLSTDNREKCNISVLAIWPVACGGDWLDKKTQPAPITAAAGWGDEEIGTERHGQQCRNIQVKGKLHRRNNNI
jgi:hypothetical protein